MPRVLAHRSVKGVISFYRGVCRESGCNSVLIEQGGYTPIEALKIRNEDIVRFLDGLPMQKIHCSVLAEEAVKAAIEDYQKKKAEAAAK